MSNVTIKSMPVDEKEIQMEITTYDPKLYQALKDALQKDAGVIVAQAVERGIREGAELSKAMVLDVRKELYNVQKGANKVMAVQINDKEMKKLTHEAVPFLARLIINAKAGINSLLIGPAGCGKTFAAHQLAEALGLEFGHLNLTAGASETWLFGRQTPTGFIEGTFSRLYKNGGVFLADEMDAADANLLLCINTAIAGDTLYNPISGETIKKNKDFVFVGAANTYGKGGNAEYTGRSRLDAATLDRFVMIAVGYNTDIEEKICHNEKLRNTLWKMREVLLELGSKEFISTRGMQIAQKQLDGGVSIVDILDSIVLSWAEDVRNKVKEEVAKFHKSGGKIKK